jgi:anhydro-N-acetylmuramic acid kinase
MSTFRILGLMSGTSMDGLDIADVVFSKTPKNAWKFDLVNFKTFEYTESLRSRLSKSLELTTLEVVHLNNQMGSFFAQNVNRFIEEFKIPKNEIDAISSHGHTVFHQPEKNLTFQIANGAVIASETGINTISDFRIMDVSKGGNGAPLVPLGDFQLFGDLADSFLNLGGFSNISYRNKNKIMALDICPVNVVLNHLANLNGKIFDKNGELGRKHSIDQNIFVQLNQIPFYSKTGPKSLGIEWVNQEVFPILKNKVENITTFYEHIAFQIAQVLKERKLRSVFLSGGGAKNSFLVERIKFHYPGQVIIPRHEIVDYKEAIIFAFLGLLRLTKKINTLCSVTGAKSDSISGVIHIANA